MLERMMIFLINIFLPPLSVMILAGVGPDCLINTLLFICGVIPAHIHGFYISCTYYSRKRKVRKGRFPGGRKSFIYSQQVINGGASDERVRELWKAKCRAEEGGNGRKKSGGREERTRSGRGSDSGGSGEERTWDGRRESRRVCTRNSTAGSRASSVRYNNHGQPMTEVKGWRM
ncbi:uncharacterized protein LY89DRAFT_782637 [Mollisia scopiformis]|uniref:Uncharacterized protein n=1 Tax=Mollisia scopiformis TaxID=149040 RepID=A0A194X877_MOLSC|nr:uncharacterized protein LY89DRAFT_782637 [Mollisia scopiformis]KUJ16373.1 hypothetical protein LY89DRAFT_782637 [Mollisia scopiformis]